MKNYLLIEEDDFEILKAERSFLASELAKSARLRTVKNGLEAIDYLLGTPPYNNPVAFPRPDVIVLDVVLPKLNGLEFLEWLQQDAAVADIPVIAVSGSISPDEIRRAFDLGAAQYYPKPIDWMEIARFVEGLEAEGRD
jgi:CheY-like chemotaxis protein